MASVFVDWTDQEQQEAARYIADAVVARRDAFVAETAELTGAEIPEIASTERDRALLLASIAENTTVLMTALLEGTDPSAVDPPPEALALARELARRGGSLAHLLRAYRIGQARFTSMCMDVADDAAPADNRVALRAAVSKTAAFIDHLSERVTLAYEEERERWIASRSGLTQYWISQILTGAVTDAEQAGALEYPLDGMHLAMALWIPESKRSPFPDVATAVQQLLTEVAPGAATLAVHTEPLAMNAWLALHGDVVDVIERLRAAIEAADVPLRVAVGLPGSGIEGFRAGHRQAAAVKALTSTAVPEAPALVWYAEIAPVAMLAGDLTEMRTFVAGMLGPLAEDTDRAAELRETLRVHLSCNRSPATTAARMNLHRNTIRYRIQQATEELRRDLEDIDPFTLTAALEICRWYGHGVLIPRRTGVTT
ncbi:PucR family transcriptional regulator [Rhodococcus sp. NPDC003382]|uniref:PucR family transcriptional regulator n=1 Tax=unclassified Rhodococcus (in: high G+C Gram-positive bacteria) TaxID=192944 RepID=UPI0018CE5C28|nr:MULTISPECIES: helix-turn-helix domain-containing protein [unclassified Rhodococcus (in: high G+C Gram-positive bacteria)]MBH0122935.1 helix-turn-helix domain-containing protein [Rhodococcus sp. CX]MCK8670905.1 helix-turn-helix domain-containing protein [Rhodococcus sp. HM1]